MILTGTFVNMAPVIWTTIAVTFLTLLYLRGKALTIQFLVQIAAFAIISALLFPDVKSMIYPVFPSDPGALPLRIFVAAWWLLAARLILLVGRFAYSRGEGASRLAFDLTSATVNVGVLLVTLNLVFEISVFSLVTTSGVIAIVLGLALQSTLGDLFSGIAISVEEPFELGDYILIDGSAEGTVIETNWRATRLISDSNDIATIPNSSIAKARILNRSRPTEIRSGSLRVILDPALLPERGIELIEAAILATKGIDPAHPSEVSSVELRGEGISYDACFSAPRRSLASVRSALLNNIARNAHFAGVALGMQSGAPVHPITAPERTQLLRDTQLFSSLSADDLNILASKLVTRRGSKGECLFQEGDSIASLFIVVEGVFEILLRDSHGVRRIDTIAPGDHLGELSLLTGEVNPATMRALTRFNVYEITKDSMTLVMKDHPQVFHAIETSAADALSRLEKYRTPGTPDRVAIHFVDKMRSFFDVSSSR